MCCSFCLLVLIPLNMLQQGARPPAINIVQRSRGSGCRRRIQVCRCALSLSLSFLALELRPPYTEKTCPGSLGFYLCRRVANRNRVSTQYLECVWLHDSPGPLWPRRTGVCLTPERVRCGLEQASFHEVVSSGRSLWCTRRIHVPTRRGLPIGVI